jgi:hypothetical protein
MLVGQKSLEVSQMENTERDREEKIPCNTRLYRSDFERAAQISTRLRLERAEVIRRAVREGLKYFDRAILPGT